MGQFVVIILGFLLGLSYPLGIEPLFFEPAVSISITGVITVTYLLIGYRLVNYHRQKILAAASHSEDGYQPEPVREVTGRYYRSLYTYRLALLFLYAFEVYICHWPLVVTYYFKLDGLIFVTNFLILTPLLITYILGWLPLAKMDRFLTGSRWGLKEYFLFQLRGWFALIILPLLLLLFFFDIISYTEVLSRLVFLYPFLGWLFGLVFIAVLYCGAPFALKIIWSAKPLSAGFLRTRLENLVKKAGFGIRDFLIWPVGLGRIANAMIIGLVPRWRYIIFTDTLLDNLTDEEIEAVCGHEIGHARHHHLFQYLLFAIGYIFLLVVVEWLAERWLAATHLTLGTFLVLPVFIFYWVVVFGIVSRRFERQADFFGATVTNNFEGFIRALEKITRLNGYSRSLKSIQHPSVEKRVAFLIEAQKTPELVSGFERSLKRITLAFNIILIIGIFGVVTVVLEQIKTVPLRRTQIEARELAIQGEKYFLEQRYPEAIESLNKAIKMEPNEPAYYVVLSDALAKQTNRITPEVISLYQKARDLRPIDPVLRMYLAERLEVTCLRQGFGRQEGER